MLLLFVFSGKIKCSKCKKSCSGEAIRLNDKYFHAKCFKCIGKHFKLYTVLIWSAEDVTLQPCWRVFVLP